MRQGFRGLAVGLMVVLGGCAAAPSDGTINDPFEATNRRIYAFNTSSDSGFVRSAGEFTAAAPIEVTQSIVNFSDNASLPGMVANGLLQGDIGGVATNTMRFLINSTVGVLGLLDPAGAIGIEEKSTDFGQTLAVWGFGEGAYVVLPLLGPSTVRDAVGEVVDIVLDPLGEVGLQSQIDYAPYARVGEIIIERGQFGDTYDSILYDSADSYAQARLIYLQNRRFELGEEAVDAYIDPYAE